MAALAIAIACGGGLAGCVSTQQKNARAKIVATRVLDSRRPQRVTRTSADVRVSSVTLVRGGRASAVVVELRSSSPTALADLPVEVGVRVGSHRRPLNAAGGLDWFQSHVPAIAANGTATWIFLTRRPVAAGGRPYARVGAGATALPDGAALPRIATTVTAGPASRSDAGDRAERRVRVRVDNDSGIPQYGVQLYALVRRGGRLVAAGKATVRHLGTGARTTAAVALAGAPGDGSVRVHAIPTIFE
ncbi:hypothetical protein [Conexibacter sp. CPCC 206217]|uniref:hypothetical protein n=1 Tax=Conexibacter sp. CPCC 206217 TaxID=3064574 RepID=UPI0027203BD0|nr:hypothetical protein [Conexibacter sp. CPCC 206217]MDO8211062.1 hypothetical protein [Conexibacter sp. CPCC 206217]